MWEFFTALVNTEVFANLKDTTTTYTSLRGTEDSNHLSEHKNLLTLASTEILINTEVFDNSDNVVYTETILVNVRVFDSLS